MHINVLKINNNIFVKKKIMSSPYSPDYRLRYPQIDF